MKERRSLCEINQPSKQAGSFGVLRNGEKTSLVSFAKVISLPFLKCCKDSVLRLFYVCQI